MKKAWKILTTGLTVLALILVSLGIGSYKAKTVEADQVKVGFIYDGDAATPYSANFMRAEEALRNELGDRVTIVPLRNVSEPDSGEHIRSLADAGCDIIFTTSYGYEEAAKTCAHEYPNIEFCQATGDNANTDPVLPNYHTFMGEIYEGRYVSGVLAGMKLHEMIAAGTLTEDEAIVGYVAAFPFAEVISGYTAFFLGVRSVVPGAVMKVKYANTWSGYAVEYQLAKELIDEGCVLISQHSDTIGPAVACEEAHGQGKTVIHVGYNTSMESIAPATSLVSSRINWNPYVLAAVKAVMNNEKIEDAVPGHVHGNDVGAGFERDWVQLLNINDAVAAKGSGARAEELIEQFKNGGIEVFKGPYTGVNPYDETDTIDLSGGFQENADRSAPAFAYVLDDVIEIE